MNRNIVLSIIGAALIISGTLIYVFNSGAMGCSEENIKAAVIDGLNDFITNGPSGGNEEPSGSNKPTAVKEIDMEDAAGNGAMLGDEDAPVTIVEFSDFQCPYCAKFITGAYPQIKSDYIETGKVKLYFRNFPLSFHSGAKPAAMAVECARDQEGDAAFFAMHDKIFANNGFLGGDAASVRSGLIGYAKEIGMDEEEFAKCYDENKFSDKIDQDIKDGQGFGISGTPSFLVNGELIVGAQSFSTFQSIIEEGLK